MSLHRCTEADCPFLGQAATRGCGCHQTDEQVLRAIIADMCVLLDEGTGDADWIGRADAALARAGRL